MIDKNVLGSGFYFNPLRANYCHTWHMENHPFLWRRIRRVRRIQVCMARKGLRVKQCPIQVFRKCHHHLRRADWTRCVVGFTSWTSWSLCWGSGDGGSGHAALPIHSSVAHTLLSRGLFLISPRFDTPLSLANTCCMSPCTAIDAGHHPRLRPLYVV